MQVMFKFVVASVISVISNKPNLRVPHVPLIFIERLFIITYSNNVMVKKKRRSAPPPHYASGLLSVFILLHFRRRCGSGIPFSTQIVLASCFLVFRISRCLCQVSVHAQLEIRPIRDVNSDTFNVSISCVVALQQIPESKGSHCMFKTQSRISVTCECRMPHVQ